MNSLIYGIFMIAIVIAETPSTSRSTPASSSLDPILMEQSSERSTVSPGHDVPFIEVENPVLPYKRAVYRPRLAVSRLTKSFNYDYDPFFIKTIFVPLEKRHNPIKVVSFKRNRLQPRMLVKANDMEVDSNVAEKQSPFNELPDLLIDSEEFAK